MAHERDCLLGREGRDPEVMGPIPHGKLDLKAFWDDNKSGLASQEINKFYEQYNAGKCFMEFDCADRRVYSSPYSVVKFQAVGVGFPYQDEYKGIYNFPLIRAIAVRTHFDGIDFTPGKRPAHCGGGDTSAAIDEGTIVPTEGITGYVKENVHKDILVQDFLVGKRIASCLDTGSCGTVAIAHLDHRRGLTRIVGEFLKERGFRKSIIPESLIPVIEAKSERERQAAYDPAVIYAEGMPEIPRDVLSYKTREYLEMTDQYMAHLLSTPDFCERQASQNPWALVISTSKVPIENRHPMHFGNLETPFKVDIPRAKSEQVTYIDQETIVSAIDQMEYAIRKSVKNHDNPSADFSNSHVLLIETSGFDQSVNIANQICAKKWMKDWLALPDHQVLVSEVRAGYTLRLEEFNPLTSN
jgi:hypothetical protein